MTEFEDRSKRAPESQTPTGPEQQTHQPAEKGKDVLKLLREATQGKHERPALVAGLNMEKPDEALEKFSEALQMAGQILKDNGLLDDIEFEQLTGQKVGEATSEGIKLDPALLLHPIHTLTIAILHEASHRSDNGLIANEALVHARAEALFHAIYGEKGTTDLTDKYNDHLNNYYKLLGLYDATKTSEENAVEIYELYAVERYDDIFDKFVNLAEVSEDQKNERYILFQQVFPELKANVDTTGANFTCTETYKNAEDIYKKSQNPVEATQKAVKDEADKTSK